MKVITKIGISLFILSLINSCSSDSSNEIAGKGKIPPQQATIEFYSKNYGYSNDNIIINGTNFTTDLSKVKVFFDEVAAEINSVNNQEINVKLPNIGKSIPTLKVEIENRIITNNVQNDYNGNIGILASSLNTWHVMDTPFSINRIYKSQLVGVEKLYFSISDSGGVGVYRTKDGGITWSNWGRSGFYGSFYATSNDEGWTQTFFGVNKVPIGGSNSLNSDVHPSTSTIGLYISDDLINGFLISYQKIVYKTTDGITFNEVYNNDVTSTIDPNGSSSRVRVFSELDKNNIWAGGDIVVDQNLGYTPVNKFYAPLILFLDNGNWTERTIPGLNTSSQVKKIQFLDKNTGYIYVNNNYADSSVLLNKLFKSIDGGNSWGLLYDAGNTSISSFSFKDQTIGWFCSGNKIYKTIDGGISWAVDYTSDSNIINISYNNGIVWAVTNNKILKYFTE